MQMKAKGIIALLTAFLFNAVIGIVIGSAAGIDPLIIIGATTLIGVFAKPLAGVLPMAINITSAYAGEVLEKLLVRATTGNELVERGLMRLQPGIKDKFYLPRLRTGKMLQKRKEQPEDGDSKGNFTIDERLLQPVEFMAFTTFNPRAFENFWRPWQPKGELVFTELPPEAQNALLAELAKAVDFELGGHFINGEAGDDDDHLFNGVLTRIVADTDVLKATESSTSQIARLKALVKKMPKTLRANPKLRILMSVTDADQYDDELSAQPNKGANITDLNAMRFKGIKIEPLAQWPDDVIVATYCGMDIDTNLWGGVSSVNDYDAIKIAPLTNAGERYFFKMLMKADTNTVWGQDVVLPDNREEEDPEG